MIPLVPGPLPPAAALAALLLVLAPLAWAESHEDDSDDREMDEGTEEEEEQEEEHEDGDDEEEAEEEDELEVEFDEVEREVKVEVGEARAEFKLEREAGEAEDELKFIIDTEEVEAKLEFTSENVTGEDSVELKVRFLELREFRDADGDGAFDQGEEIVQTVELADASWRDLAVNETTVDGAGGQKLTAVADLPGGGRFGLDFIVLGDFATVGAVDLMPTDVKFDIRILDFPFAEDGTLVALLLEEKHEAEHEVEVDEDAGALVVDAGGVEALLTWASNATVDGADSPVGVTVLESESETESDKEGSESEEKRLLAFAYARGGDIAHDPVMGVRSSSLEAAGTPGFGVAFAVAAVAAVAFMAAAARRRR